MVWPSLYEPSITSKPWCSRNGFECLTWHPNAKPRALGPFGLCRLLSPACRSSSPCSSWRASWSVWLSSRTYDTRSERWGQLPCWFGLLGMSHSPSTRTRSWPPPPNPSQPSKAPTRGRLRHVFLAQTRILAALQFFHGRPLNVGPPHGRQLSPVSLMRGPAHIKTSPQVRCAPELCVMAQANNPRQPFFCFACIGIWELQASHGPQRKTCYEIWAPCGSGGSRNSLGQRLFDACLAAPLSAIKTPALIGAMRSAWSLGGAWGWESHQAGCQNRGIPQSGFAVGFPPQPTGTLDTS